MRQYVKSWRIDLPVIIANASSSLGSLKANREPGVIFRRSVSSRDTSRVMGIGNNDPSARRSVSTTLLWFESQLFVRDRMVVPYDL